MTDDDAWGALAELVRLKDVKEEIIAREDVEADVVNLREDYETYQPLAWQRARDALLRHEMHEAEVEAGRACPDCGHPKVEHHRVVGCLDGWGGGRAGGCRCEDTPKQWLLAEIARRWRDAYVARSITHLWPTDVPHSYRVPWTQTDHPARLPNPVGSPQVLVQVFDADGYGVAPSMWVDSDEIELAVRDATGALVPGEYVAQIFDAR